MKKLIEIKCSSQIACSADGIFKEKYRHRMPDSWTVKEFETLKEGYICGKKIKVMARELGRSETAVNKFLSKSGIRKLLPEKRRKSPSYFYKVDKKICPNIIKKIEPEIDCREEKKDYSSFADIISYLVSKGNTIRKNRNFGSKFYKAEEYILNEKATTKGKLLIFANKLRVEENKPIFKVMDFIW